MQKREGFPFYLLPVIIGVIIVEAMCFSNMWSHYEF